MIDDAHGANDSRDEYEPVDMGHADCEVCIAARAAAAPADPPDEHESHGDGSGHNPYALAAPEPPQRATGWRHLAAERWRPDRIRPAPYNERVRRMPPRKLAALRAGLVKFGFAGTFLVRAEDGLLIGGHRRFEIALALIQEHAGDLAELERLNVYGRITGGNGDRYVYGLDGVSLAVSPILGIPDADALALNILLNNREAQGEFEPMGLAEALSALDGAGFDVTDTGFTIEQVGSLVTWEPDDTREGGAKSAGADVPATVPRGTSDESATEKREKSHTAGPLAAAPLVLPCTRDDVERACAALRWVVAHGGIVDATDRAAFARVGKLLELPREVLGDDPPLTFGEREAPLVDPCEACGGRGYDQRDPSRRCGRCNGAGGRAVTPAEDLPPDVCRRCRLGKWAHKFRSVAVRPGVAHNDLLCADGQPGEFGEVRS